MRLFLFLNLIFIICIHGLNYYKEKINSPPQAGTLSYYLDKIHKKEPLSEKDAEEIQLLLHQIGNEIPQDLAPKQNVGQRIKDDQRFHFYLLLLFSGVLFINQYLIWEYVRDHLFHWLAAGMFFMVFGIIASLLSEQNVTDVLLLKKSTKYIGTPMTLYAAKPFAIIIWGYILVFNSIVCLIINRVHFYIGNRQ